MRWLVESLKYIFLFVLFSISSPSIAIEFRALGRYIISDIHSRLLGHISTTRYSSKFRALRNYILSGTLSRPLEHVSTTRYSSKFRAVGENEPIGKILPTPRAHFGHTESIEVPTAPETETYWNDIFEYSDGNQPIKMIVSTAHSNFDYVKLLQTSISKCSLVLLNNLSETIHVW